MYPLEMWYNNCQGDIGGNPSMVGEITAASTDVPNAYVTGAWLKTHLPLRAKGTAVAAIGGLGETIYTITKFNQYK